VEPAPSAAALPTLSRRASCSWPTPPSTARLLRTARARTAPFTEALLAHIEEPGLEVNFLFRKIRDAVRAKTQRRQEPFVYGSPSSELLYFKAAR